MKLLSRCVFFALLIYLIYTLVSVAQNTSAGIEFNGHIYQSLDAVQHAARNLLDPVAAPEAMPAGDIPLYCGHRNTIVILVRGYYDGRYDPVVCFTTEAERDQLYAENRAFAASREHLIMAIRGFIVLLVVGLFIMLIVFFSIGGKTRTLLAKARRQILGRLFSGRGGFSDKNRDES